MTSVALKRFFFSSLALWLGVSLAGVYFLAHIKKFINFGVDLVGGTYITLEVEIDKAIESDLVQRAQAIIAQLKKADPEQFEKMEITYDVHPEERTVYLEFSDEELARTAEASLLKQQSRFLVVQEGRRLKSVFTADEIATLKKEAVQGNIAVLERRLNPYGAGEITIVPQGDRHIVIELPNVHDVEQAKRMIGKTALLEIKPVEDNARTQEELLRRYGGKLPDNLMIVPLQPQGREKVEEYIVVPRFTDITGRLLKDAHMGYSEGMGMDALGRQPVVYFAFKPEGADKFHELTRAYRGRRLAIIIDNIAITAPVVNSEISGGEGQIQGSFTEQNAQELALLLKSGAFVAPVRFEEERHIGPSLGAQSIRSGLIACAVGLCALFLFSVIVYKVPGILAFIVLLFNILLILFAFSWLGATLTLPGIAGMLLTIGMAIDASILIYERIREELASGSTLRKAVNTGFSGAMSVILDANITHFLVALVLYKLGAGPVKGFAIAMIVGIVSTLITGIILLKSLFNFLIDIVGVQKMRF